VVQEGHHQLHPLAPVQRHPACISHPASQCSISALQGPGVCLGVYINIYNYLVMCRWAEGKPVHCGNGGYPARGRRQRVFVWVRLTRLEGILEAALPERGGLWLHLPTGHMATSPQVSVLGTLLGAVRQQVQVLSGQCKWFPCCCP
jgi:hypothetical protein